MLPACFAMPQNERLLQCHNSPVIVIHLWTSRPNTSRQSRCHVHPAKYRSLHHQLCSRKILLQYRHIIVLTKSRCFAMPQNEIWAIFHFSMSCTSRSCIFFSFPACVANYTRSRSISYIHLTHKSRSRSSTTYVLFKLCIIFPYIYI